MSPQGCNVSSQGRNMSPQGGALYCHRAQYITKISPKGCNIFTQGLNISPQGRNTLPQGCNISPTYVQFIATWGAICRALGAIYRHSGMHYPTPITSDIWHPDTRANLRWGMDQMYIDCFRVGPTPECDIFNDLGRDVWDREVQEALRRKAPHEKCEETKMLMGTLTKSKRNVPWI